MFCGTIFSYFSNNSAASSIFPRLSNSQSSYKHIKSCLPENIDMSISAPILVWIGINLIIGDNWKFFKASPTLLLPAPVGSFDGPNKCLNSLRAGSSKKWNWQINLCSSLPSFCSNFRIEPMSQPVLFEAASVIYQK